MEIMTDDNDDYIPVCISWLNFDTGEFLISVVWIYE